MGGPSEIICHGPLRKRPEINYISSSVDSRVYICMYVAIAMRSTFPVIFQSHCRTLAPSGIVIAHLQHGDVWADSSDGFMFALNWSFWRFGHYIFIFCRSNFEPWAAPAIGWKLHNQPVASDEFQAMQKYVCNKVHAFFSILAKSSCFGRYSIVEWSTCHDVLDFDNLIYQFLTYVTYTNLSPLDPPSISISLLSLSVSPSLSISLFLSLCLSLSLSLSLSCSLPCSKPVSGT